jgi:hypothetical protein
MKHSYIWDRDAWLRLLALVLIGLAAGPEIGLAIEMTTVLEILGAVIFFYAFSVGAKMLLMDLAAAARDFICPPFVSAMSRPRAIVYAATRSVWLGTVALVIARYCLELSRGWLM